MEAQEPSPALESSDQVDTTQNHDDALLSGQVASRASTLSSPPAPSADIVAGPAGEPTATAEALTDASIEAETKAEPSAISDAVPEGSGSDQVSPSDAADQDSKEVNDQDAPPAHMMQDETSEVTALHASDAGVAQADLNDLRQRVMDARGSRAQLPPGWEDGQPLPQPQDPSSDAESSDSSTSSSDSDSSDSESSEDENLPARNNEAESDYDSDQDDPREKGAAGSHGPATKNELPKDKATKLFGELPFTHVPEHLTPTMKPLGVVHGNVEEVLVIAQFEEKQYGAPTVPSSGNNERTGPVLDAGSLVCLASGQVLGLVFETFGSLLSPLYSVLLPSSSEASVHTAGTQIFYLPSHSSVLRPAELRAQQGKPSDASNVHDEEPNEWDIDAMEFSDDEEEAEYKRRLKEKRRGNKRNAAALEGADDAESALAGTSAPRGGKAGRGRGRGRGGTANGSTVSSRPTGLASLPARPQWHLDDPAANGGVGPSNLSYDAAATQAMSYEDDAEPSKPLSKPPSSAGLPVNPMVAAASPAQHTTSGTNVALPQIDKIESSTSSSERPPPGAHINPLFAHRWGVTNGAASPTLTPSNAGVPGTAEKAATQMFGSSSSGQYNQQQQALQYPYAQQMSQPWQQPQYAYPQYGTPAYQGQGQHPHHQHPPSTPQTAYGYPTYGGQPQHASSAYAPPPASAAYDPAQPQSQQTMAGNSAYPYNYPAHQSSQQHAYPQAQNYGPSYGQPAQQQQFPNAAHQASYYNQHQHQQYQQPPQ